MRLAIFVLCFINLIFFSVLFFSVVNWVVYIRRHTPLNHYVQYDGVSGRDGVVGRLSASYSGRVYDTVIRSNRSIGLHRARILAQLRRAGLSQASRDQHDTASDSNYSVQSMPEAADASDHHQLSGRSLLCRLRKQLSHSDVTVTSHDEPFKRLGLARLFPSQSLFGARRFNNCAVVSSAGALLYSRLGSFIDSNDAVVRFNGAPTRGFEADVGHGVTLRVLNSRMLTERLSEFEQVATSDARTGTSTLLIWDPCCYGANLTQFFERPDFPLFQPYFERRLMLPEERFHLMSPAFVWGAWDFLQQHSAVPVPPHPPSSGFLGILLMLSRCDWLHVLEYMPSVRQTAQCHYYSRTERSHYCTMGAWHPLAAEKLLVYRMNEARQQGVFGSGVMLVPGFSQLHC